MLIRTIDTDTDEVVKLETITLLDDAATSRTRVTQYFTLSMHLTVYLLFIVLRYLHI